MPASAIAVFTNASKRAMSSTSSVFYVRIPVRLIVESVAHKPGVPSSQIPDNGLLIGSEAGVTTITTAAFTSTSNPVSVACHCRGAGTELALRIQTKESPPSAHRVQGIRLIDPTL